MSEQPAEKVMFTECVVGSKEWVYTVQEYILDNRVYCFVCGESITYKRDFFYLRARGGTIMMHDDCFTPWSRQSLNKAERAGWREVEQWRQSGDWLTIHEAAHRARVGYMTIYQRIAAGTLKAEKRRNKWYVAKESVDNWMAGRSESGHQKVARRPTIPKKPADAPKARMWRSEVTESPERVTAHNAAKMIGVSRSWVLQRKETFDAVKISGAWMLSKKLVEDYIREEEQRELESAG